jgi:cellulose synthase/poly-beta-1,6-N-acetylglucosamine synthase-like glycosyltransferase
MIAIFFHITRYIHRGNNMLSKIIAIKKPSVLIAIPTINSGDYIYKSLTTVFPEIRTLNNDYNTHIVIALNGSNQDNRNRTEIQRFIKDHPNDNLQLIYKEGPGKNGAMNKLVQHAKKESLEIIHFLDDDINLEKGSLSKNIKMLLSHPSLKKTPLIAASNFIVKQHSLTNHVQKNGLTGPYTWALSKIFGLPFKESSPTPLFFSGQSFAMATSFFPTLPNDSSGVTDDTFLSNYVAIQNKEQIIKSGFNPVLKTTESKVYFEVPDSLSEWWGQQKRIYAGVNRSFRFFGEDQKFLENYFSWEFAFEKKDRLPLHKASMMDHVWHFFDKTLKTLLVKSINSDLSQNKSIQWSSAKSTKPLPKDN